LKYDNRSFPKNFIETIRDCSKNCKDCFYCKKIAERVLIAKNKSANY
jgi:hypothetical protein